MAMEVLQSKDALIGRRRAFQANAVPNLDRKQQKKPSIKHDRRKSNVDGRRKRGIGDDVLAAGQVTLLRRGESLASKIGDTIARDLIQNQNTPPPCMVIPDIYAGSTFELSPSPRCLPLPTESLLLTLR